MVNKRLRYDILRRDDFRCTYCGATPTERQLHVDHVVPKALGGADSPENLTTACEPCNSGKASTAATDRIIQKVNEAVALEQAARNRLSDLVQEYADGIDTYEDQVQSAWEFHVPTGRGPRWDLARIAEWYDLRVPVSLIEFGLRVAIQSNVSWSGVAAYSAGVIRNKIQEVQGATHQNDQT